MLPARYRPPLGADWVRVPERRAAVVAGSPAAGRFLWEVLCAIELSCEQSRVVITRAAADSGASRRYRAGAVAFIPWPAARKG